jgi:hypothetical protein
MVDVGHLGAINRRLEQSYAISAGVTKLPGLFLLGLVSAYDVFLSKLIRAILMTKPELLSSSERNIFFKDLMEVGSVEAARERIIEKEVESVIRSSHSEQIAWLERKLNMKLTKDFRIWPGFIEICERRNLTTNTAGTISSQYLKTCKEHGYDVSGCSVGDTFGVGSKYYERAVEVILEMGVKLTQVIWRKLLPKDVATVSSELNEFSYRLITKRNIKRRRPCLNLVFTQ